MRRPRGRRRPDRYCDKTHFTSLGMSSSLALVFGWPLPSASALLSVASASALPLYLAAISLKDGPAFLVSIAWQFMQPLDLARSSCALARLAPISRAAPATTITIDFIVEPPRKTPTQRWTPLQPAVSSQKDAAALFLGHLRKLLRSGCRAASASLSLRRRLGGRLGLGVEVQRRPRPAVAGRIRAEAAAFLTVVGLAVARRAGGIDREPMLAHPVRSLMAFRRRNAGHHRRSDRAFAFLARHLQEIVTEGALQPDR